MSVLNIFIYFLGFLGLFSWTLILFFLQKKNPKSTYDIIKILTTSIIILKYLGNWIFAAIINFADPETETVHLIVDTSLYLTSQLVNTVTLFNLYSFAFEYRAPKIDPNLPHWLTCLLGILIPFFVTFLTNALDGLVALSNEPDYVKYFTGTQGERFVHIILSKCIKYISISHFQ